MTRQSLVLRQNAFIRAMGLTKKLAANVPLPFRPEWYASDPFDNIKEAQQG
ncbi:hypothetical protein [Sporomusa acidovorans]|uniref:hypothetical protein n=1 Tax=Sporomusa acidovorans TaxID=112900 RepID=UPI001C40A8AC|nr:hypothetical protein [Sporomusa acidovorans]